MAKKMLLFLLAALFALSLLIFGHCRIASRGPEDGDDGGSSGEGEKWGSAIWGQGKWSP